jgi:hypothetical protein
VPKELQLKFPGIAQASLCQKNGIEGRVQTEFSGQGEKTAVLTFVKQRAGTPMRLDYQDVAILIKLNELAERFGLKAYEINAQVGYNAKTEQTELNFTGILSDDEASKKANAMFDAIVGKGKPFGGIIAGEVKDIIDVLDQALAKAPRPRIRP